MSEPNTAPQTSPVATPPKKPRKRKVPRQSKSIWKKIPYRAEYQSKPIFKQLLAEMLTWPKSYFQKDSRFINSDMPMSHFICARLIIEAAQGDLGSIREILDRVDGRPPMVLPEKANGAAGDSGILIHVLYETPDAKVAARQAAIDERNAAREAAKQKQLPQGGIEYIDVPEKK